MHKINVAKRRCPWVDLTKPDYIEYHDKEWGVPVHDDRTIFEFLTLEGAQAGLSWYTVLRKREAYRKAFRQFDPERVARYGKRELAVLAQQSRHHPQSAKNRRRYQQRPTFLGSSAGVWQLQRIHLALRERKPDRA